jgi:prophage regulatory protein
MTAITPRLDRFLSRPEVLSVTGWSPATLWRQVRANRFPAPVRTSGRRVGWPESEIVTWQEQRIAERDRRRRPH